MCACALGFGRFRHAAGARATPAWQDAAGRTVTAISRRDDAAAHCQQGARAILGVLGLRP